MPASGIVALTAALGAYALLAPLRRGFVTLLVATLLVPSTLVVPNGITSYLTIPRVVLIAFAAGLAVRWRRGELPANTFRITRLHAALAILATVAFINGVALPARTTPFAPALSQWVNLLDQLAFFVVVLSAVRAIDDHWWVGKAVAGILVVFTGIAVAEHFTERSWSRWFFEGMPDQLGRSDAALPLEQRAGAVRVRSAAPFALAFAWVTTMLFPILMAVASRAKRAAWLAPGLPAIAVIGVVWSYSRSALAALAIGGVAFWILSRLDLRVGTLLAVGAVASAVLVLLSPSLLERLRSPEAQGSVEARRERLPVVLDVASQRPFLGVGLGGLETFGVPTTDSSYLLLYAELGVIGMVAFIVTLGTAALEMLPGVRAPPSRERILAAAALTGAFLGIVGAGAYDLFSLSGSARSFWLLAALGIALSERAHHRRAVAARPTRTRAGLIACAIAGGLALSFSIPNHAAPEYRFQTIPAASETFAGSDLVYVGNVLARTACEIADLVDASEPAADVGCRERRPRFGIGSGLIRIVAPDVRRASLVARRLVALEQRFLPGFRMAQASAARAARPTWARTAPVWLGFAALALAVFAPAPRSRTEQLG